MKKFNENGSIFSTNGLSQKEVQILESKIFANEIDKDLSTVTDIIYLLVKSLYELESLKENGRTEIKNSSSDNFPTNGVDFYDSVKLYKISLIKNALRKSRGRQNKAAKLLNLKTTTLNAIIKKYDIYL